ncbi:MAG: pectin acetylesterase-family hydrolase [Archaeoglobaceae archaeon]
MRLFVILALVLLCIVPTLALGEYDVLVERYADPFKVDVSSMPPIRSLPVDDPEDGVNWVKIPLPKPCVNGVGEETFIMVRKGVENNLLIFFEGGGACADYKTCRPLICTSIESCMPLFQIGDVITLDSKFWILSLYYRGGIFDVKNPKNPFRNWTIVFVPYNTGDIHMGNRVVKYYDEMKYLFITKKVSKTVYHVGYVNAIVALRYAAQNNWDKIVVAGSSAGGYGTILHTYSAWKIFGKPVITINDAGPGIMPSEKSKYQMDEIMERWGTLQNFPRDAIPYFQGRDPIYAVEFGLKDCPRCIYTLFEDQMDSTIGEKFSGYSPDEFRERLLRVTNEIRANFSDRFCRFMPFDDEHTMLTGGLYYPLQKDRFYNLEVKGYKAYQWVGETLKGNCLDLLE